MQRELWAFPSEFAAAAAQWHDDAVDAISAELHPLLRSTWQGPLADLPRPEDHSPSTAHLASPLHRTFETSYAPTMRTQDAVEGSVETYLAGVFEEADLLGTRIVAGMISHVSEVCEANGQSVDTAGRDFFDAFIDSLEKIEVPFDKNGDPDLTVVVSPDTAAKLRGKTPTPEQESRIAAIYERKWQEWNAARRRRELP